MSNATTDFRRKIGNADDLRSVVRTMKAISASNIGQYEQAVRALDNYMRAVEWGLSACFRHAPLLDGLDAGGEAGPRRGPDEDFIIVFGSDQGLVGQFNETVAALVRQRVEPLPPEPPVRSVRIWAIGERVHGLLTDAKLPVERIFEVPRSVKAATSLIGTILLEGDGSFDAPDVRLSLVYNRPRSGALYNPYIQRLLPLDAEWARRLARRPWPTNNLPEIIGGEVTAVRSLIREYLFASLFSACVGSLASENASRLAAMQKAERNIDELLDTLRGTYHRARQQGIDAELFDVVSGFEALADER